MREFTENVIKAVGRDQILTKDEKIRVHTSLSNVSEGDLLEPVVALALLRTKQAGKIGAYIEKFRYIGGDHEIDVIIDIPGSPLTLIEVKRDDKEKHSHLRHLCNPEVQAVLKYLYGTENLRIIVLYRGETIPGGKQRGEYIVEYINIENFLRSIEKQ